MLSAELLMSANTRMNTGEPLSSDRCRAATHCLRTAPSSIFFDEIKWDEDDHTSRAYQTPPHI
jgi:hypothetical protein